MGSGFSRGPSYAILRGPHFLDAYAQDMKGRCPKAEDERYFYQGVGDEDCSACRMASDCARCNREWKRRGYREGVL